jgi:uncharacterized protein with HEPN domain
MPRQVAPVLAEILGAIEGIEQAVAGKTLADFEGEWLLKHGVQRGIEIISEAARHIPPDLQQSQPDIPWKQFTGIGSVLRHEDHRIADDIVWRVVVDALPKLKTAIEAIRADLPG